MDTAIAKAQERLDYLSSDKETRALIQAREDATRELNSMLRGAKEEGREEGRKEGREEGRKEGRKEGRIEVARQMLLQGAEIESIKMYTGLSQDEIAKLENE